MEKISIGELTLVRFEIERVVLDHAIDKADESDIEVLRHNIFRAKEKIQDNETAIDEHIEFHNLLAKASKNHVFVIVSGSLAAAVRDILTRITLEAEAADHAVRHDEHLINSKNSVHYHEKILEAMLDKKKERATLLLKEHLSEVEGRLRSFMG